jgi:hypothetical protein
MMDFPSDLASHTFANALKEIVYEFDIGSIRKYRRKLFLRGGKNAVRAVGSSVNN